MDEKEKRNDKSAESAQTVATGEQRKTKGKLTVSKWVLAICAVALALVFFLVGWFGNFYSIDSRMRTLMWLVDTLDKKYYKDVDLDKVYDDLYDAVVPDRFSGYISPEEFRVLMAESEGTSSNFGIALSGEEEEMHIARVVGNSSADRAGIRTGMYLYRFGMTPESLQSGTYEDLSAFLSGKANRDIVFECGFTPESKQCYVVRSEEYLASYCEYRDSEASFKFRGDTELALTQEGAGLQGIPADTGYIRLYEFEGNAAQEFAVCLAKMSERGRRNLVLDLRYNGGGYLNILQSISSYFLKNSNESTPVVATAKYRNGKTTEFRATGNAYGLYFDENSKITVLADEFSASASECLMGVMVDYGAVDYNDIYLRMTDDGTAHSYGKGVMQSTYVTVQGDAFRLTAAEIFWPSGKSIHGVGVTEKDGANAVVAPLLPNERDLFLEKVLNELMSSSAL